MARDQTLQRLMIERADAIGKKCRARSCSCRTVVIFGVRRQNGGAGASQGKLYPSHSAAPNRAEIWYAAESISSCHSPYDLIRIHDQEESIMRPTFMLRHASKITLFTRANCGLCDSARAVLSRVWDRRPFDYEQVDIMAPGQERWKDVYEFDVPVVSGTLLQYQCTHSRKNAEMPHPGARRAVFQPKQDAGRHSEAYAPAF